VKKWSSNQELFQVLYAKVKISQYGKGMAVDWMSERDRPESFITGVVRGIGGSDYRG